MDFPLRRKRWKNKDQTRATCSARMGEHFNATNGSQMQKQLRHWASLLVGRRNDNRRRNCGPCATHGMWGDGCWTHLEWWWWCRHGTFQDDSRGMWGVSERHRKLYRLRGLSWGSVASPTIDKQVFGNASNMCYEPQARGNQEVIFGSGYLSGC